MKNQLKNRQSLYLKQHSQDPIHWLPWSNETFLEAQNTKKLIFISIGYASCHWCHVMHNESFKNAEIAKVLNEFFVCIKVDREENPEVDKYYQRAAQLMSKNGGWPLSVFLQSNKEVIFIGTYFPLEDKPPVPGFLKLIKEIMNYSAKEKDKIHLLSSELIEKISLEELPQQKIEFQDHFPSANAILKALKAYADTKNGGYGKAPKFPLFAFYEAFIEQIAEGVVGKDAHHIIDTIEKTFFGGVVDQLRGGIHRYSTDENWTVPHFEKMLYDQSGFLKLLAKSALLIQSPQMITLILKTLDYLQKEMMHEEGHFFSSQDADSEGYEGIYFCFSEEEVQQTLTHFDIKENTDEAQKIKNWLSITSEGNFQHRLNVISLNYHLRMEYFDEKSWVLLQKIFAHLFIQRSNRIPPATDTKGIASWNFMMISALTDVILYATIPLIKTKAEQLLKTLISNHEKNFFHGFNVEGIPHIKHTTTLSAEEQILSFEDYLFYTESKWRLYQLYGENHYLEMVLKTLQYITKEFQRGETEESEIKDDTFVFYENPPSGSHILKPIPVSHYDQSYKSPLATFFGLIIEISTIYPNFLESCRKNLYQKFKDWCLISPLSHGEALRYIIYPEDAYRKIEVPKYWIQREEFQKLRPYFSHRFIFYFTENNEKNETLEKTDKWQICRRTHCEETGYGFESFFQMVTKKPPSQSHES